MRLHALGTCLSAHITNCALHELHVAFASWGTLSVCISAVLLTMHQQDMHQQLCQQPMLGLHLQGSKYTQLV